MFRCDGVKVCTGVMGCIGVMGCRCNDGAPHGGALLVNTEFPLALAAASCTLSSGPGQHICAETQGQTSGLPRLLPGWRHAPSPLPLAFCLLSWSSLVNGLRLERTLGGCASGAKRMCRTAPEGRRLSGLHKT